MSSELVDLHPFQCIKPLFQDMLDDLINCLYLTIRLCVMGNERYFPIPSSSHRALIFFVIKLSIIVQNQMGNFEPENDIPPEELRGVGLIDFCQMFNLEHLVK